MKPVTFPDVTVTLAKDQPPYVPLPAFMDEEQTITCWQVSWRERMQLLVTGRLWLAQLNFGRPLQPQLPSVKSPFDHPAEAIALTIVEVPR